MRFVRSIVFLSVALVPLAANAGTISWTAMGKPSGSNLAVNVAVMFKNVGNNLEVSLFNNFAGTDPLQILSGLVWDVSGAGPTGTTLSSALTGAGSGLYTSGTAYTTNAELRNSVLGGGNGWQYLAPTGKLGGTAYEYGIGASGLGGTFGGLGNASYGIIGPSSNLSRPPLSTHLPLVMNTSTGPSAAVFIISGFNSDVSRITDVQFAFGSAGTNNLAGTPTTPIPEPASLVLLGTGAIGVFVLARRKLRARVA